MEDKLREHIEQIFSTVPCTVKAVEMKEEILQNLIDKYHDLIAEGKNEQAAYNIAVASIGDVNELLGSLKSPADAAAAPVTAQQTSQSKRRGALLTAIAVALYILSPVPCILLQDGIVGPVLLFVMVAAATGLLIYKSMTKETYVKKDDTMVEEFIEWKQQNDSKKALTKALSGILWTLVVVAYFIVSFTTGAWHVSWIIFLVGAALESILKTAISLTK